MDRSQHSAARPPGEPVMCSSRSRIRQTVFPLLSSYNPSVRRGFQHVFHTFSPGFPHVSPQFLHPFSPSPLWRRLGAQARSHLSPNGLRWPYTIGNWALRLVFCQDPRAQGNISRVQRLPTLGVLDRQAPAWRLQASHEESNISDVASSES